MEFDLKVTRVANRPDFRGFGVEQENTDKIRWFKCKTEVYNFLNQVKPCIITIAEQVDEVVKRVNLVKKLDSPELNNQKGIAASSDLSNFSKETGGLMDIPNGFNSGDLNHLLEEFLADAEETLINRRELLIKRRPNRHTAEDIENINHKLQELYKLMDNLENGQTNKIKR